MAKEITNIKNDGITNDLSILAGYPGDIDGGAFSDTYINTGDIDGGAF